MNLRGKYIHINHRMDVEINSSSTMLESTKIVRFQKLGKIFIIWIENTTHSQSHIWISVSHRIHSKMKRTGSVSTGIRAKINRQTWLELLVVAKSFFLCFLFFISFDFGSVSFNLFSSVWSYFHARWMRVRKSKCVQSGWLWSYAFKSLMSAEPVE